jgi:hypothetical protein
MDLSRVPQSGKPALQDVEHSFRVHQINICERFPGCPVLLVVLAFLGKNRLPGTTHSMSPTLARQP